MAVEVVMPRLGWDMKVGRLAEWLKRDGDRVEVGDVLCSVEGDKATSEVESLDSGVLRIPPDSPPPGAEVAVGTVLAYLVQPGETAPFEATGNAGTLEAAETAAAAAAATARPPADAETRSNSDADAAVDQRAPRHMASPRARRAAADLGVDVTQLRGSGRGGRVLERDVLAASTSQPPRHQQASAGVRRLIAGRMADSARTTAAVTLTTEADASALVRLRAQIAADLAALGDTSPPPSYTDFLVKLAALALQDHPDLNASWAHDRVERHPYVHIGLAVDTPRGLLVPVVRDVPTKNLHQLARELADLVAAARSGAIAADDLHGGTFTITNLGMYEIDAFTPIINLPECAVLGVGRIIPRPVVVDPATETVGVRQLVALSLSFDHRVVDGAPAARFLRRIKQLVEHPGAWVAR
jgi:pyruvate dehydrogenase E2 component (dihydrolipoamide acetyltransferase)